MIRTLALAGAATLLVASAAPASAQAYRPGPPAAAASTRDFVTAAAQSDEFERRAGRLAQSMARSRGVRDFGAMMVQDHTKTTRGLQDAIRKSGRPVPPPPALTGAHQGMLAQLRNAGRGFDGLYLQQQVQAHQEALGLTQGYARSGDNPFIRDAARSTVPLVQGHLRMAQDLQATVRR